MRGMVFGTILLLGLAMTDLWFSSRLLAHLNSHVSRIEPAMLAATAAEEKEDSVQLVEQALNSRYMQWGAVGVMLALFTWIITKQQPNQEKRREAERREERVAFLTSLEKRTRSTWNRFPNCDAPLNRIPSGIMKPRSVSRSL